MAKTSSLDFCCDNQLKMTLEALILGVIGLSVFEKRIGLLGASVFRAKLGMAGTGSGYGLLPR
jgi:hypothetical protein